MRGPCIFVFARTGIVPHSAHCACKQSHRCFFVSLSFWKGEVNTSYAVSLFLRVEMHLSRRTDDFGAFSEKNQP